jgi:hypothetical protein
MAVRDTDTRPDDPDAADAADHLRDLPDGCGCAEVWEHLSEGRE